MKLCLIVSLLPLFASYIISGVSAYSVEGYASNDVVEREVRPNDLRIMLARGMENDELDVRSMMSFIAKFKSTKAEKERIKKFKEGTKEYRNTGKKIAAEAKKEMGKNYDVKVMFYGPGQGEYGAQAKKVVQAGWHSHRNLQQWKIADVTVKVLPSGRKMATARFNNGPGTGAGASTTYLFD